MRIDSRSGRGAHALAACLFAVTALAAATAIAQPITVTALTTGGKLVTFSSATPGTLLTTATVTGLQPSETLVGIDYRPRTGEIYGLGSSSRLYKLDLATGAATAVGATPFTPALNGTSFGFDFNPTVDRIRIVSDADQNLRLHPDTGAVAATDANLNPGDPNVVAAAYIDNFAGAPTTTLFDIDSATDSLVTQNPPNAGTLTTVGPLGIDTGDLVGFDIAEGTNAAFASLTAPTGTTSTFYLINLTSGAATAVGTIGGSETIADIALPTTPVVIFGLTSDDRIIRFGSGSPGTTYSSAPVTGLQPSETLLGIDFRPRTGQLYALGSSSRLYVINTTTGAATAVGAGAFTPALSGTDFGFDFNPTVDRIRIVSNADQNLRVHPDSGMVAGTDTALNYTGGTPADPNAVAAAYTNNFAGATTTALFDIDSATDTLVTQAPPNDGVLTPVGALGVDTTGHVGFDIAEVTGAAFASLTAPAASTSSLYTVNLTTGAATLVGTIGVGTTIKDIAIPTQPPEVLALTTTNSLLRVASGSPGTVLATIPVSGLQAGEVLIGIDFRPRTGQLYGLGSTSRLYTIDTTTGVATAVGGAAFTPALNGTDFGFDFNPTVDRIRVVSDADQNLRLHPDTGAVAATDTALNPGDPSAVGAAYTNNFAGATTTTLFDLDAGTDSLVIQNPPNNGTLVAVGALGVDTDGNAGFDIAAGTNAAFASLTVGGTSNLYTINLTTGAATLVGAIGGGTTIRDIALGRVAPGLCGGGAPLACLPCLVCDGQAGCVMPTDLACQPAFAQKATISIVDKFDDSKDTLSYKWVGSAPVALGDYGLPTTTSDYRLCIFDGAGHLQLTATAPAGGTCSAKGKPCWAAKKTSFVYGDAKELTPNGLASVVLKAGDKPKKASIVVKGKKDNLNAPMLPLTTPITVRVQRSDGDACFEAVFGAPKTNKDGKLAGKSD